MTCVRDSWDGRIHRADELAGDGGPAASLLTFYSGLLRAQRDLYDSFGTRLSGAFERDLSSVRAAALPLLRYVVEHGPDLLVGEARRLLEAGEPTIEQALRAYWAAPADHQFFAKAILQPYGQRLADAGIVPLDRSGARAGIRCPRCGGAPQVSILEAAPAESGDGGARQLLCADCLTPWPFSRVLCPSCGEADEGKIGYFQSSTYAHLRLDVCETCRRYLKSVDLSRLGLAVPIVDEVAGATLDLWARERGYEKIELNLAGL